MKIAFFGDSYADLIWHKLPDFVPEQKNKPWSMRLLEHYRSPVISSGLGGSNLFYAIKSWLSVTESGQSIDYAIFTFTWHQRLYHYNPEVQKILSNWTERRQMPDLSEFEIEIIDAVDRYYSLLESYDQVQFLYELQLKWILDLPRQYPDIKFIFLPNTEYARTLAKKHFDQGVLLDFAFETISANEGELVGQGQFVEHKFGHMFDQNHERFKNQLVDVIDQKIYNAIVPINYGDYKL